MSEVLFTALAPTVIPAQAGFQHVRFEAPPGGITAETKPSDLVAYVDPVIAWIVQPCVDRERRSDVDHAAVTAVEVDGSPGDSAYLVDPLGQWSLLGDRRFPSETATREHFIAEVLAGRRAPF